MKWKSGIKLAVIWSIVALVLGEVSVRVIFDTPSLDMLEKTHLKVQYGDRFEKLIVPNQQVYEAPTPLTFNPERIKYRINNLGYRGKDINQEKQPDVLRIVVLGGSHVFDLFGSTEDGHAIFTQTLEQHLNKRGISAEVINAGIPGQDLKNIALRLTHEIRQLQPDVVLISSIYNDVKWINYTDTSNMAKTLMDLGDVPREKLGVSPFSQHYHPADRVFGFSKLYLQLRGAYWSWRTQDFIEKYRLKNPVRNYTLGITTYHHLLEKCIHAAQEIGAQPVLCLEERKIARKNLSPKQEKLVEIRTFDGGLMTYSRVLKTYTSCDSTILALAEQHQLPVIDHVATFQNRPDLFKDLIHTTPEGSRKLGELYAESLVEVIRSEK